MGGIMSSKKTNTVTPMESDPLADQIAKSTATRKLEGASMCVSVISPGVLRLGHLRSLLLPKNDISEIPPGISNLTMLYEIDLSQNKVSVIPEQIGKLTNLETCVFKNNQISKLPLTLTLLKLLNSVNLAENRLSDIDVFFSMGPKFTHLDCSYNYISSLPEIIKSCDIQELKLSGNTISELPNQISNLKALFSLDMHYNRLAVIHQGVFQIPTLMKMNLKHNRISNIPQNLSSSLSLGDLNLADNCLIEFPVSLCDLPAIKRLYLSENKISSIPEKISNLQSLVMIYLEKNPVTSLPCGIFQMNKLILLAITHHAIKSLPANKSNSLAVTLNLSRGHLEIIPQEFSVTFSRLTKLTLANNKLGGIPDIYDSFPCLKELRCGGNQIRTISPEISKLSLLNCIDFSSNKIDYLPESIGSLPYLRKFICGYNKISNLPTSFSSLTTLTEVFLTGNPIANGLAPLSNLVNLQLLWIGGITDMYFDLSVIDNLSKVTNLDISRNNIAELKNEFHPTHPLLTHLDLSINSITQLKESPGMSTLRYCNLQKNQMSDNCLRSSNRYGDLNKNYLSVMDELRKMSDSSSFEVGFVAYIGKRPGMEDEIAVNSSLFDGYLYLAVFDGHDGPITSAYLRDNFHKELANHLDANKANYSEAFKKTHTALNESLTKLNMPSSGSTSTTILINPSQYIVANCGDSRAILCRGHKAHRLTVDHKPSLVEEERRIRSTGSFVSEDGRISGLLAVSRGFGDFVLSPHVSCEPTVRVVKREEADTWLVIASDGLWDEVTDDQVAQELEEETCPWRAALKLRDLAYMAESTDNITIIAVKL